MIRVKQETGSYCGPAVFEMLVSDYGLKLSQEEMVEACKARQTVMKVGIPLVDLAKGLRRIYPDLVVWQKTNSKIEDLKTLLENKYLVAVNWQGIFTADEYGDDEQIGKWENLQNKLNKVPELKGSQGHYCIALDLDYKKGFLRFVDPYGHYAGKDRFVATWEFEERWWDDRYGETNGKKVYVFENRLMFLVAKKGDKFPASLGMIKV